MKKVFLVVFCMIFLCFVDLFCMENAKKDHFISISKIADVLTHAKKDSICIFDIDGVLSTIEGYHLGSDWWAYYEGDKYKTLSEFGPIWELVQSYAHMTFVEKDKSVLKVFNVLKARSIKFMGFTARGINLAERTRVQLEELGIRFQDSGEIKKNKDYLFKYGILFVRPGKNKGEILKKFLGKSKPNHLVFIDDKDKNVLSVKKMCETENIPCEVLLYTAMHELEKKLKNDKMSKMICDFQLSWLIENKRWVDVEFARNFIENCKFIDTNFLQHLRYLVFSGGYAIGRIL